MKRLFRQLSIKNKLIMVIFGAATTVSIGGFLLDIAIDAASMRKDAVATTRNEMQMLGQDFVKVALFSDVDLAADVVSKLRAFPLIYNVFLYDRQGQVMFRYHKSPSFEMEPPGFIGEKAHFSDGFMTLFHPVEYAGSRFGNVFVRVSTEKLDTKMRDYLRIMFATVPVLLVLSYLLALWLHRYFSDPIVRLAQHVSRIATEQNFDTRIGSDEINEIGILYRSFDQLLQTIRESQQRLRQSETRLSAIIGIAGSGIISIDESHHITLFNRQAERIFGYVSHEVIGQSVEMLMPESARYQHAERVNAFRQEGVQSRTLAEDKEIRGLRKGGEEFPIGATISQMELDGRVIFTVAINDISQRRQTEWELETYRAHLEDLVEERTAELRTKNRELEAFSYSIAHDLRAPLRSVTSFSQILLEEASGKLEISELDSLQRIVRAGTHMSVLIDSMLELARIGRSRLIMAEVELSAVAERVRGRLEREQPQRQVRWHIQPEVVVRGDPQLLEVVMENLLGNAWKYSSKKETAVISFGVVEYASKRAYFVRDNGAGFDMKYVDSLFGVFQRLHNARDFEGTGIGLATVQRVIQRHSGAVWAEGAEGEGATFFFTLP